MQHRFLGRSGLKVSAVSYGNWITHGSQVEDDAATACVWGLVSRVVEPERLMDESRALAGRIVTVPFSFKEVDDEGLIAYVADQERCARVAGLAVRHARLRHIAPADKKVALVFSAYPTKHARIGNAVGLDTPASAVALIAALGDAGYDLGTEGLCSCGWVGPLRDFLRRGQALIDANQHRIDTKPRILGEATDETGDDQAAR